jgi:hypothetical protein
VDKKDKRMANQILRKRRYHEVLHSAQLMLDFLPYFLPLIFFALG